MWTIGRSQRVEEKKYRPIVRKIRYIFLAISHHIFGSSQNSFEETMETYIMTSVSLLLELTWFESVTWTLNLIGPCLSTKSVFV
jgi:hypothetical protein